MRHVCPARALAADRQPGQFCLFLGQQANEHQPLCFVRFFGQLPAKMVDIEVCHEFIHHRGSSARGPYARMLDIA
jgi:hypothetical protein